MFVYISSSTGTKYTCHIHVKSQFLCYFRSFLVLQVTAVNNILESYVASVDECFEQYNLETYYQVAHSLNLLCTFYYKYIIAGLQYPSNVNIALFCVNICAKRLFVLWHFFLPFLVVLIHSLSTEFFSCDIWFQPPLFHISIAWCLDDVTELVTPKMKQKLKVSV